VSLQQLPDQVEAVGALAWPIDRSAAAAAAAAAATVAAAATTTTTPAAAAALSEWCWEYRSATTCALSCRYCRMSSSVAAGG
jgi:hypothetical protein